MKQYKYKLGLVVGRMQPFHLGHLHMLKVGFENCEKLVILLGSAQFFGTSNNPCTYAQRESYVRKALIQEGIDESRFLFAPVVDIGVGNSIYWGNYIMNTCKFITGNYPDVIVGGREHGRDLWLDQKLFSKVEFIEVERELRATDLRAFFIARDNNWKAMVPSCLIEQYEQDLEILRRH